MCVEGARARGAGHSWGSEVCAPSPSPSTRPAPDQTTPGLQTPPSPAHQTGQIAGRPANQASRQIAWYLRQGGSSRRGVPRTGEGCQGGVEGAKG